jgi:MoaA/NifB/PqqE/SkfB family radical SAM enzyme
MDATTLYPVTKRYYHLHLTADECTLFFARPGENRILGLTEYKQWILPQELARFLAKCDGKTCLREIAESMSSGVHPLIGEILVQHSLAALQPTGVLSVEQRPHPDSTELKISGGFDSFAPLHMSFEITETCNFRCQHCYVSASPEKHGRKNGKATLAALDLLADKGVKIIELTGGECTTHPEFKDILHHAAGRFFLVAIITNGYLLGRRPDLAEFVASHPNVIVQVSIDGLAAFHDRFRGKEGSFDAACRAISRLRQQGTFVRIGMSVSSDNLDQIVGVFHLAKSLDVSALSVAPVTGFGRGSNIAGCAEIEQHVFHRINELLAPYAHDPLFDSVKRERAAAQSQGEINCGAGWRTFALNSNGTVRSCLFLADSKKFGNIDTEDYDDLFRQKWMRYFHDAPSPGGKECQAIQPGGEQPCKYIGVCTGCFAKAFRVSETEYPHCPWRAKYFPGMTLSAGQRSELLQTQGTQVIRFMERSSVKKIQ